VFTWSEIASDWLLGAPFSGARDATVDAFNQVERVLGRDWMNSGWPIVRGPATVLAVVRTAELVAAVEELRGSLRLLDGLRDGDHSLIAEIEAIRLIRTTKPSVAVELEPTTKEGRMPDFRVRWHRGHGSTSR
jgi:hypothetical protein